MWIWLGFRKCQAVTQANNACKQSETANALNSFVYIVVFLLLFRLTGILCTYNDFCWGWTLFPRDENMFPDWFDVVVSWVPFVTTDFMSSFSRMPHGWFDCVGNISQGWGCKCCSSASVIQFEIPMELRLALWDRLPSHAEALKILGDFWGTTQSPGHVIRWHLWLYFALGWWISD